MMTSYLTTWVSHSPLEMSAFLVPLGPLGLIFHDCIFDYFRLFILRNFQERDEERERWTKINYRFSPDKKKLSTFFPRIL